MYQANDLGKYLRNYCRRRRGQGDSVVCYDRRSLPASYLVGLLLFALTVHRIAAQEKSPGPLNGIKIGRASCRERV